MYREVTNKKKPQNKYTANISQSHLIKNNNPTIAISLYQINKHVSKISRKKSKQKK